MPEKTYVRPSFIVVSILSLLWIGGAFWAMHMDGTRPQSAFAAIQLFAIVLAPVAALFALASALGNREHLPEMRASDSLEDAESRLTGIATRIDSLRNGLAGELEGLTAASAALEAQARTAQGLVGQITAASVAAMEASRALEAAVPAAAAQAETLRLALSAAGAEARAQAGEADAATRSLAKALEAAKAEGKQASSGLSEALGILETRAAAGRSESEAGIRAIRSEAEALYEFLENTLVAKRDTLNRQGEAMASQLADGYARLEALAAAASEKLAQRLEQLSAKATAIETQLAAQTAATETLATSGERAFQRLDARLEHSSETSRSALDKLAARIQEVGTDLSGLTQPLKDTQGAAQDLESAVKHLRETALQTADVLGETLPARTVEAGKAAETLSGDLRSLVSAIDAAHARAERLAEPISESRASIDAASEGFAAQRQAIEAAGQALVVELTQASQLIREVEEQTRDTSLSAATRLVEAMARVREVATQATGTMREMLDGVLAEAKDSLAAAADEAMRRGFAEPIAERAREAEAAASAAAQRTAGSMAALTSSLKMLNESSMARMHQFETAQAQDLLAASTLLRDRLAQASVSIASALGRPMDDADWAQWRKGERGLFSRRALSLLDKSESKALKSLFAQDADFAKAAQEFSAGFEALVARFEGSAPVVASALRGSDHGRLAAALSEVIAG